MLDFFGCVRLASHPLFCAQRTCPVSGLSLFGRCLLFLRVLVFAAGVSFVSRFLAFAQNVFRDSVTLSPLETFFVFQVFVSVEGVGFAPRALTPLEAFVVFQLRGFG